MTTEIFIIILYDVFFIISRTHHFSFLFLYSNLIQIKISCFKTHMQREDFLKLLYSSSFYLQKNPLLLFVMINPLLFRTHDYFYINSKQLQSDILPKINRDVQNISLEKNSPKISLRLFKLTLY